MRLAALLFCSLFVLTNTVMAQDEAPTSTPTEAKATDKKLNITSLLAQAIKRPSTPNTSAESTLENQIDAVQLRLQNEEKKLKTRFVQLGKMREQALQKNDQKQLNRVEELEKKALRDYEQRIGAIMQKSLPADAAQPQEKGAAKSVAPPKRKSPQRSPEPSQQRRRFRLWPFAR